MKMRTASTADVRRRASETTTTTRSPRRSAHGEARPAGTRRSARQQQHTTTGGSATIALQRQQSVHAAARLLKTISAPLRRRRRLPAAASVTTHDQRRTNGKQRRSRHRRAMLIDPVLIDRRTSRTQMEGRCGHRCEEVTTRCGAAPSDGEAVRSPTWIGGAEEAPNATQPPWSSAPRWWSAPCSDGTSGGTEAGRTPPQDGRNVRRAEPHDRARRGARTPPRDHQEHPPLPTACSAPTLSTPHSHGAPPLPSNPRAPHFTRARRGRTRTGEAHDVGCLSFEATRHAPSRPCMQCGRNHA